MSKYHTNKNPNNNNLIPKNLQTISTDTKETRSKVKRRNFQKNVDVSVIEEHPQYKTWMIDINKILDSQFPQQPGESDEMFQKRKEYCECEKTYTYTKHFKDDALCVPINSKYRVLLHWETSSSTNSIKWTQNASNGKYLKATVEPSDRQNDK